VWRGRGSWRLHHQLIIIVQAGIKGVHTMVKDVDDIFEKMRKLQREAERSFFDFFGPSRRDPSAQATWHPAADVYETDAAWVIQVELAGVRTDDVSVSLAGGVLRVQGIRRNQSHGTRRTYHQAEINYRAFERHFLLAGEVEENNIRATFENGLLTITIPKAKGGGGRMRKVPIESR